MPGSVKARGRDGRPMGLTPQGIMGAWIALGMVAGVVIGILSRQLILGVLAGVGLGIALGAYVSGTRGREHPMEPPHGEGE